MPLGESGSKTIPIVRLVKNRKRGLSSWSPGVRNGGECL